MPAAGTGIHNTVRALCNDVVAERLSNQERDAKLDTLQSKVDDLCEKVQLLRISVKYLVKTCCESKCTDFREYLQEEYCREHKENEKGPCDPCACCAPCEPCEPCEDPLDPCDPFEPLDPCDDPCDPCDPCKPCDPCEPRH